MKKTTAVNILSSLTVAALLAALAGCASSKGNYQTGAATGAGLVDAGNKIMAGNDQIDATLGSLNDLVNNPQGNLAPQFKTFNDNVAQLKVMNDNVKKQFTDARVKGNQYFKDWDDQISSIRNPDIQNASIQRKNTVMKEYNDLKRSYAQVQIDLSPFMSDLNDIQTALGNDLTMGGIGAVKPSANKAKAHGIELKKSLTDLSTQFKQLGTAMESSGPAAQPAAQ